MTFPFIWLLNQSEQFFKEKIHVQGLHSKWYCYERCFRWKFQFHTIPWQLSLSFCAIWKWFFFIIINTVLLCPLGGFKSAVAYSWEASIQISYPVFLMTRGIFPEILKTFTRHLKKLAKPFLVRTFKTFPIHNLVFPVLESSIANLTPPNVHSIFLKETN